MRLSYDTHEVLNPWCELQTPSLDASGTFSCAGFINTYYENGACTIETDNNVDELLAGLSDQEIQTLDAEDWAEIDRQTVRVIEPIDCNKLFLCGTSRCACDDSSCRADSSDFTGIASVRPTSYSYAELTLRASPDGDGLVGVFNNGVFANERQLSVPVGVVHFQPAE